MRWEGRLHGFGATLPTGNYGFLRVGDIAINQFSWGLYVGINGNINGDTINNATFTCCVGATGANGDLIFRAQRDTAGVNCGGTACYTFELCWTLGGSCLYQTLTTTLASTWSGGSIFWLQQGLDLAFLRWYPTVVTAGLSGAGLATPISIVSPTNPSALMGDWEFEGNLSDSSGNAAAWTTSSGATSYVTTPVYNPTCFAGGQQSLRAGTAATLNGTGSMPLDGGAALAYEWQQVAGVSPVSVQWTSSQRIGQPTAILPQFGPYNFQLTVTDSSNHSSSCAVHDGAAPSDNNGVVIYPPGAFYSAASTFLGSLIQWGKNPWPWYDTAHKAAADANIATLGPPVGNGVTVTTLSAALGASDTVLAVASSSFNSGNTGGAAVLVGSEQILLGPNVDATHIAIWQRGYRGTTPSTASSGTLVNQFFYWDWWDYHQGPGTVSATAGSATLTGTGTQFISGGQYAVCNADGTPNGGSFPVVWHPTDSTKSGRVEIRVISCSSDTQLTMSNAWSPGAPIPGGSGLTYSIGTTEEAFWLQGGGSPTTINYYDNVVGYYLLYLRSGIDTYLLAARQLADTFYFNPFLDQGYAETYNDELGFGFPSRAQSNLGLWLRSLDSPLVNMTTGLHRIAAEMMYQLSGNQNSVGDARESGYMMATLAYVLAMDTDTTQYNLSTYVAGQTNSSYAQAAAVVLKNLVSPTGSWNYYYTGQSADGGWLTPDACCGSYGSSLQSGTSVTLTNGSTAVVGTGTAWNCTTIPTYQIYAPYELAIWFWHIAPGTFPSTNAGGDASAYLIASCTDSTHLTLTTAYTGASCPACGYEISMDDGHVGWGVDGYAMGIAARTMHYAAMALTDSGDSTDGAYARALALNASTNFLLNKAFRTDTNGFNYGVDFTNCVSPIAASNEVCSRALSIVESIGYSAEGPGGWFLTYQYNQDGATKAATDALYNQMWANPNVPCSAPCNNSVTRGGNYLTGWDLDVNGGGWWLSATTPQPKWFGQFFGFGDYSSWPAVRLGGALSSAAQQVYIAFSLASVANAAKVVVAVTTPFGTTASTTCAASPCSVTLPRVDQPGYSIQLQYQSAGGAVLASSSLPVIESQ
jgi:hypothetical protein